MRDISAFQLWLTSLSLFFGSTAALTLVDFIGATWFAVLWQSGPDMFPNTALGYPLIFAQLLAGGILVAAGVKTYYAKNTFKGLLYGLLLVLFTTIVCLFIFYVFVYWYHVDLMGRSL